MVLMIKRRIRDNLHGSVDISDLEDMVIAHHMFQRLGRIKQTAFLSYVFPGATHTRFAHSLGVLFLAKEAWSKLRDNQTRLAQTAMQYPNFPEVESKQSQVSLGVLTPAFEATQSIFASDEIFQTLRLAALLHDVGHPPFSHSGEILLPSYGTFLRESKAVLPRYLEDYLKNYLKLNPQKESLPVPHEIYSAWVTHRILTDIQTSNPSLALKVDPQNVVAVMSKDILPVPGSDLERLKAQALCNELISGDLDLDRMDYLLRDAKECGVIYGIFDVSRVMDSICFYFSQKDHQFHLGIQISGLCAFEDYLRARQSMYIQLYFHKTAVATEAMLKRLIRYIPGWHLPVNLDEYTKIDDHQIVKILEVVGKNHPEFQSLLQDTCLNRNLWKRIYEVIAHTHDSPSPQLEIAKQILAREGIPFEEIVSRNDMTKLTRKDPAVSSKENHFHLVAKDASLCFRVAALDHFSELFTQKRFIRISRLYSPNQDKDGSPLSTKAKALLIDALK